MSKYNDFFLKSSGGTIRLQCLEIYHPNFSKTYRIVLNDSEGVTVKHEDGLSYDYQYYPAKMDEAGNQGDLDQKIQISFGDLGEIIPQEFDNVNAAGGFVTKPTIRYREYRSDDLDSPMLGPAILQGTDFSRDKTGSTFEAHAPFLNISKTGEFFTFDRFPGLRGYL